MPIEIRELVIRATVDPGEKAGGCAASPPAGARPASQTAGDGNDDMVQTCVREVLRILEDKRER